MNYTEYTIEKCEHQRLLIATDIHNCHIEWHGITNEERMELFCKEIKKAYEKTPFDSMLCLGDYSLDHWAWDIGGSCLWNPPISRTDEFMKKYYPKFPEKAYLIPGNHEQYGEEDWKKITGFPREYAVVYGNYVFAMLDTFGGDLSPTEHADGTYTGINVALVTEILEKHPDKRIILCMHDLIPEKESEDARKLIFEQKQILCAMTGHTHRDNTVLLPDSWRNLAVFYCGDFSYNGGRDKERNWGYRILDFKDGKFSTEYVRVDV